jgi:hypothetical protein
MTSGATPPNITTMNATIATRIHVTQRFSTFRCMKCFVTKYALTMAMPNAVMSVTMRTPSIGPRMLMTSSTHRIAQMRT